MKARKVLLVGMMIFINTLLVYGQDYRPVEKQVQLDKQIVNAWVVQIDEPMEPFKKSYSKYAKQQLNVKVKKSGKHIMAAKEVTIPRFSQQQGDLKAKFFTIGGETTLAIVFLADNDMPLNSVDNPIEMYNLRNYTKDFVKYYKTNHFQELIAVDKRNKDKLVAALKKDKKEYKNLSKRIPKVEALILSEKTKETKKVTLKNENIDNRSRILALDKTIKNLENEIVSINENIEKNSLAISNLEKQFAAMENPLATQK